MLPLLPAVLDILAGLFASLGARPSQNHARLGNSNIDGKPLSTIQVMVALEQATSNKRNAQLKVALGFVVSAVFEGARSDHGQV